MNLRFDMSSAVKMMLLLTAITVALFLNQFLFLANEYWGMTERISKGPIIWGLALFMICRDLNLGGIRQVTVKLDLAVSSLVLALVVLTLFFAPLITPTILLVYFWYLLAARIRPGDMLVIWIFLLFSLPYFTDYAWIPLQHMTVLVTENLLALFGIPALVQQFFVAIPAGIFEVEEGCSGVRYLANNLILVFLFGFMNRFGLKKFVWALLMALPLSLAANWVRVSSIILVAHWLGMDNSWVVEHDDLGWAVYAISLLPFFYLLLRIQQMSEVKEVEIELDRMQPVFGKPAVSLGFVVAGLVAFSFLFR